jgi:hypothetical protein
MDEGTSCCGTLPCEWPLAAAAAAAAAGAKRACGVDVAGVVAVGSGGDLMTECVCTFPGPVLSPATFAAR